MSLRASHFSLLLVKQHFNSTVQRTGLQAKKKNQKKRHCHLPYSKNFTICTNTCTLPGNFLSMLCQSVHWVNNNWKKSSNDNHKDLLVYNLFSSIWVVWRLKILQAFKCSKSLISLFKIMWHTRYLSYLWSSSSFSASKTWKIFWVSKLMHNLWARHS